VGWAKSAFSSTFFDLAGVFAVRLLLSVAFVVLDLGFDDSSVFVRPLGVLDLAGAFFKTVGVTSGWGSSLAISSSVILYDLAISLLSIPSSMILSDLAFSSSSIASNIELTPSMNLSIDGAGSGSGKTPFLS
jgi:hypothetical protein